MGIQSGRDVPAGQKHRWECPICGAVDDGLLCNRGSNALRSLKVHVYFTEGGGHGDAQSYPNERGERELAQYVSQVVE